MILDKLVYSSKLRVEAAKTAVPPSQLLAMLEEKEYKNPRFKEALLKENGVSVIAEIKKASPSKGVIRADFDHMQIAEEYCSCNVQALSVLTEPEYFLGDIKFVKDITSKFDIPVLRKDFIVDEYQIYEAKLYGADAVLLIMAALDDAEYKSFSRLAAQLGLDALVETHNETEVKRAAEWGNIIGINNRNLATFEEDITTCERLLPFLPDGCVSVAESAIRTHADFEYLTSLGFDAALIGEAFMRGENIKKAVDALRYGD